VCRYTCPVGALHGCMIFSTPVYLCDSGLPSEVSRYLVSICSVYLYLQYLYICSIYISIKVSTVYIYSIYASIVSFYLSTSVYVLIQTHHSDAAGDVYSLQNKRRTRSTTKVHKNDSRLGLIGKRPVTDYRHTNSVRVWVHMPRGCLPWVQAIQSTHTCVSPSIVLLVDTAVTVGCPRRSLDIQCKSSPVEL